MEQGLTLLQQQALTLMQAMLGVISPNFRRVSVTLKDDLIWVEVILEHDSQDDMEELKECEDEFDALQIGPRAFKFDVIISDQKLAWPDPRTTFVIYRRRELMKRQDRVAQTANTMTEIAYTPGDRVVMKSFHRSHVPLGKVDPKENYWLLVGAKGVVADAGPAVHPAFANEGGRVLVQFETDLSTLGLHCHNEIPNALWLSVMDLEPDR